MSSKKEIIEIEGIKYERVTVKPYKALATKQNSFNIPKFLIRNKFLKIGDNCIVKVYDLDHNEIIPYKATVRGTKQQNVNIDSFLINTNVIIIGTKYYIDIYRQIDQ